MYYPSGFPAMVAGGKLKGVCPDWEPCEAAR